MNEFVYFVHFNMWLLKNEDRMSDKTHICINCGAQINTSDTKCPYCGYINVEGAEKKFLSDLDEIDRNIKETKKEPVKQEWSPRMERLSMEEKNIT